MHRKNYIAFCPVDDPDLRGFFYSSGMSDVIIPDTKFDWFWTPNIGLSRFLKYALSENNG